MSDIEGLAFHYTPAPTEFPDAGVEVGWFYIHDGQPGPAVAVPVAKVDDGEGGGFIAPTGEPQAVTILGDA